MASRDEQCDKAEALYVENEQKQVDILEIMIEARRFVYENVEPWYYAGNELLGRIDAAIRRETLRRKAIGK